MGNARRLMILWMISQEELSVTEIAQRAESSLQNISQHLKILKNAGMVTTRRHGQTIYYQIADDDCVKQCPALLKPPEIPE